jgi:chromosome segregation ATPase
MGIAGKILAIANVLAAIAFIAVAALNYGQRQVWSFAVREQEFQINGLPVDDEETDADGNILVNLVNARVQRDLGIPQTVKVQTKALDERKNALLNAAGDDSAKLQAVLIPLAQTAGDRDEWRKTVEPAKLKGFIEDQFSAADAESASLGKRRQEIARVLLGTSQTPEDYNRTLAVVGLSAYAQALNAQAANLVAMIPVYESGIDNDRTEFVVHYKALLQQIQTLAERVANMQDTLKKQSDVRQQHATLVKRRQKIVEDLQQEIASARKAVQAATAEQSKIEAETFAAGKDVTTTDQRNQELERTLKNMELGR